MNLNEINVAALLLRDLERRMNAVGGGDFELPITPDNLLLVESADALAHGMSVGEWRKVQEYEAPITKTREGMVVANNVVLATYIRTALQELCAGKEMSLEVTAPQEPTVDNNQA